MMTYTENGKYASQARWAEKNAKKYLLKFYYTKDAEIIEKLESVDSKLEYIRRLIREDIARNPDPDVNGMPE